MKEITDSQGKANVITTPIPPNASIKSYLKRRKYAFVATSKQIQKPEQP